MWIVILSSVIAGIAGGMGIGGGALLIPALTIFANVSQHVAQSTNLIFFIPTALCAVFIHLKNKNIELKKAIVLVLSGIPGAILGGMLANFTEGDILRKMFGVFLLIFGLIELFKKREAR